MEIASLFVPINMTTFSLSMKNLLLISSFILFLIKVALPLITKSKKPLGQKKNLPPGPPGLPVIGHLHHLIGCGLPHRTLHRLSLKYGPIVHVRMGEVSTVVISSPDATREALRDRDLALADRPSTVGSDIFFSNDIFFCPYGDYWRQMRKICIIELLSVKSVRSFQQVRLDEGRRLLRSLLPEKEGSPAAAAAAVDLTKRIVEFASMTVCRAVFGEVGVRDRAAVVEMIKEAANLAAGFGLADLFLSFKLLRVLSLNRAKLVRKRRSVDRALDEILEEHRRRKGRSGEFGEEDIVDVLLSMQRDGDLQFPITDDNIKGVVFDMFAAGSETPGRTVDWAMAELMRNPDVMAKAQAEVRSALKGKKYIEESDLQQLKYLKMVIKETMRLHPQAPLLFRACREECEISGYSISPKTKILISSWSMGRDPKYWADPEIFCPERFDNSPIDFSGNDFKYIPFGSGRRNCPAVNFGLANVELPLAILLYHFDWRMPQGMDPQDIDMSEEGGLSARRTQHLFLLARAMEIASQLVPISLKNLLLISSFILFLIKLVLPLITKPKKPVAQKKNLPPGPPSLPVIGHIHHLIGRGLPHRAFHRLSLKYGPVVHVLMGEVPTVIRLDEGHRLVKSLLPEKEGFFAAVDLTKKIFDFVSMSVCRAVFGEVGVKDRAAMVEMMKEAVTMAAGFELADLFPSFKLLHLLSLNRVKLVRMRRKVDRILDGMLKEHRRKGRSGEFGGEDIVDVLLRMQRDGDLQFPITDDNIKGVVFDMFAAGSETSAGTLDWAMVELMRNPDVMAKAQAEIRGALKGKKFIEESDVQELKYLKLVIKETLRLHPQAPFLFRSCREECEISGYSISPKTKVLISFWSMGRDPKYWAEPEIFRPERFDISPIDFSGNDFKYVPFGSGRRNCPGINFGLANVELPLAILLYHFDWRMPKGMDAKDMDMSEEAGVTAPRKQHLFVLARAMKIAAQLVPINIQNLLLISSFILLLIKIILPLTEPKKPLAQKKNLPPGPPGLPVIGHLHHLIGHGLPHRAFHRLSLKYGPILHVLTGEVPTVVISSPDVTREALRDRDLAICERPSTVGSDIFFAHDIFFCPYGDYWRQMRKISIIELLSVKSVRSFERVRLDEGYRLVKSLLPEKEGIFADVDLTKKIFDFVSMTVCRAVFGGVGVKDRAGMVKMMKEAVTMAAGFELADLFPSFKLLHVLSFNRVKLVRMRRKVDRILDGMLEEHRRKGRSGEFGGEDIVDVLLRMQKDGDLQFPITDDNIKGVVFDMFAAGSETSSGILDWTMVELMRNPDVMAKAQAEIRKALKGKKSIEESDVQGLKYLKLVIKEAFRLHPPAPFLFRACREECEISGYSISPKTKILISFWSMGRDPKYWEEPEIFRPERFDNSSIDFSGNDFKYLPFGSGRRNCPGINFGLANVELPLAILLYHFDWRMPKGMDPKDMDMSEEAGVTAPRKQHLVVVPIPYDDS
ncbi:cytochrome P450 [Striga asiatica]|uniref:Cytochrome P450 n=1 Tax=Striga asiatica TaxID=4170 RepID=A0A5A7PP80_STRAF|nr:cytochrome P450 [Striga asiatica]